MNIVNEHYGLITPTRCGTRWIWRNLSDQLGIPYTPATHKFFPEKIEGRKVLCIVRNPYTRVRSIYRWLRTIGSLNKDVKWEDFILSKNFDRSGCTALSLEYKNNISKIDKFIKLENINKEIKDIFSINLPEYNNQYFDSKSDDGLTLEQAYSNIEILNKVHEKFELDFKNFKYEKFNT